MFIHVVSTSPVDPPVMDAGLQTHHSENLYMLCTQFRAVQVHWYSCVCQTQSL